MLVQGTVLVSLALQATAAAYRPQSRLRTSNDCPSGDGVHIVRSPNHIPYNTSPFYEVFFALDVSRTPAAPETCVPFSIGESVYEIGIRGTTEPPPYGALQTVVNKLMDELPGSDNKAIDYPASGVTPPAEVGGKPTFNFIEYRSSEQLGVDRLTEELVTFNDKCPDSGIVLLGYSQGGHIIGDALCGRYGSILFPTIPPVDYEYLYNVQAIIQLGDPTNRYDVPWHVGNSTRNGIFPRADFSPCRQYGDFWQSYCDANDFFCDSSAQSTIAIHLTYVENYADKMVDFVVKKVKGGSKSQVHKPCMDKEF